MIKQKIKWTNKSNLILERAGSLNRYNDWLLSNFSLYLKGRLLEIGAGLGGLSRSLPQENLYLADLNSDYVNYLKNEFNAKVLLLDIEKNISDKYSNYFDAILSSNVFEHIKNDQQAINNSYRMLKRGGHFLLFVPACPEIYGSLDTDMGHFRRYTLREVMEKAQIAGFKIITAKYANMPGYLTWWGRGVLLGNLIKKAGKSPLDNFFGRIFDILITPLLYLEKYVSPPFGQSIVLIAQKP